MAKPFFPGQYQAQTRLSCHIVVMRFIQKVADPDATWIVAEVTNVITFFVAFSRVKIGPNKAVAHHITPVEGYFGIFFSHSNPLYAGY